MKPAIRPWCAFGAYPDLKPLVTGTITMPVNARHDEIEAAMLAKIAEHMPPGFVIEKLLPGALFFVPDGDNE